MHHSVGGVVAIGAPLVFGGSVAIAERFSARGFWGDVARWECTAFQYIGELCRYLIAAPGRPEEKAHRLRLAIGNGLSEEVWRTVLERFGPLRVLEFYASTEGNVWLYNVEGKIGSIGRVPPYLALRDPIALARFDHNSQTPARGAAGFCSRCADGEIGEALGRIGEDPAARFEGYSEAVETEKKILRDVFKSGDAWMRTGDLMRRDADGFYTFVDRIGDTFRWKGENVATFEVAEGPSRLPRRGGGDRVWGFCSRRRRARGNGAAEDRWTVRSRRARPAARNLASIRQAAVLALRPRDRDHGDLQTEAARICRAGLRSGAH